MSSDVIGVVGAGFMGSGIAESAARAGFTVVVHEPEQAPLDRSRAAIEQSLARAVERGRLDANASAALLGRVSWSTDIGALDDAAVVVEAIVEDPKVKGKLFRELDRRLGPDVILASNTSSIPIAQIASWTQ